MNDEARHDQAHDRAEDQGRKLSWWQMSCSAVAAAFGVQSKKNRERDFQQGDIKKFVVVGVVFTLLFMAALMAIVKVVLSQVA